MYISLYRSASSETSAALTSSYLNLHSTDFRVEVIVPAVMRPDDEKINSQCGSFSLVCGLAEVCLQH